MGKYKRLVTLALTSLFILNSGCGYYKSDVAFNQEERKPAIKIVKNNLEITKDKKPEINESNINQVRTNNDSVAEPVKSAVNQELVEFKGNIQHIFFHPLIVYPKMAFDGDYLTQGYNDWFVTVNEFKKIIESLYNKNFVLIDIRDTYEAFEVDGRRMVQDKKLMVPKGKKPMIISIDDLNYYEYMIENGNAHKLIIDGDGVVKTYSVNEKGEKIISDDNDIVPILDKFVEQHPDFSLNGAKGVIALTGYEGVLGYRTNELKSDKFEEEKAEAVKLIEMLKQNGWTFACHGYGHLDAKKIDIKRLIRDTNRWKNEVEPLIGPTPVYIYPFGSTVNYSDAKFKFLMGNGFEIFCGVGPEAITEYKKDCILTDRRPIDGISFHYNSKKLMDLFDCGKVVDKCRPEKY
ncbi:MAG: hypothetical protein Q8942_04855 [Bacillota bacterium]|nr:hypothetical protein [Bacillota bacterium]